MDAEAGNRNVHFPFNREEGPVMARTRRLIVESTCPLPIKRPFSATAVKNRAFWPRRGS